MDEKRHTKSARRVGYWMTDKKIRRLNFHAFETFCRSADIDIVKLNFDVPLEQQGPFNVILHKVTDQLARTVDASQVGIRQIEAIQTYLLSHPDVKVIDPIENMLKLLDRHQQYQIVRDCDIVDEQCRYFIPSFVELTTNNVADNLRLITETGIQFPIVCKPSLSHCQGAQNLPLLSDREEMAIVFNEAGLADIEPPCVAQTFVNHNARLFKIFIIGQRRFIIQRPSIKNFTPGQETRTIFFNSNDVSKSYSSSHLNVMSESEVDYPVIEPDERKMLHLVSGIQAKFGLDLLGIDVIIENGTGRYGVIDINAFPGYDGVDLFFPSLLELIEDKLSELPPSPNRTIATEEEQTSEQQQQQQQRLEDCGNCDGTERIIPSQHIDSQPYQQHNLAPHLEPSDMTANINTNGSKWFYFTASLCADYLKTTPSSCGGHLERPRADTAATNAREQQVVAVNSCARY